MMTENDSDASFSADEGLRTSQYFSEDAQLDGALSREFLQDAEEIANERSRKRSADTDTVMGSPGRPRHRVAIASEPGTSWSGESDDEELLWSLSLSDLPSAPLSAAAAAAAAAAEETQSLFPAVLPHPINRDWTDRRCFSPTEEERLERQAQQMHRVGRTAAEIRSWVFTELNQHMARINSEKPFVVERQDDSDALFIMRPIKSQRERLNGHEIRYGGGTIKLAGWLDSRECAHAALSGVEFQPNLAQAKLATKFNAFTGFAVDFASLPSYADEVVEPFLHHLREIWCRNDETAYRYAVNSMAWLVQRPDEKLKVATVLRGKEGAGKGILLTEFLAKILGRCYRAVSMGDLTGQFNASSVEGTLLAFVDETSFGGDIKQADALKKLVTEPKLTVERKHVDRYECVNRLNMYIASNSNWIVSATESSRRYFVLDVNDKYAGPRTAETAAYFDRLLSVPYEAVAYFLKHRVDLRGWDPRRIPITSGLRQQATQTLTSNLLQNWWLYCLQEGAIPASDKYSSELRWPANDDMLEIGKEAVYASYQKFNDGSKRSCQLPPQFWKDLKGMVAHKDGPRQHGAPRSVIFPSLEQCKQAWRQTMGSILGPMVDEQPET